VDGFFQVAQSVNGQWWLLDAAGLPRFVRGINEVRLESAPAENPATPHPAVQLRDWGFNALGWADDGALRDDGFAYFAAVDFCRTEPLIQARGFRLPDVFAPDWPQRAHAYAGVACASLAAATGLIAWLPDAALAWADAQPNRPGLLQVCLSLEPAFAAYHAAWEFLLALHGGRLERVASAWGLDFTNKERVREMTRSELGITSRGYLRDEARWTREFARRYVTVVVPAIRAAAPNHLIASSAFSGGSTAAILAALYPAVDLALVSWLHVPPPGEVAGPVLAIGVSPPATLEESVRAEISPRRPARLTTVEMMLRRSRTALRRVARHPSVVGWVWQQWRDGVGDRPPFSTGLVHADGGVARTNVEIALEFNARAENLRRLAAKQLTP